MRLKSGREVDDNRGIIGLNECDDGTFGVFGGYDEEFRWPRPEWADPDPEIDLTAEDMREIADVMIDRWTRFRESLRDQ